MVSRVAALWVGVLLVLAGCTGSFSSEAGTTTTGTTTTGTITTTDPTTTAAPLAETTTATTRLTPDATTSVASSTTRLAHVTLDVEDLDRFERELLRRAVENGSVTVTKSNLTGRLTPDTDGWYVRYRGTLYELSWSAGSFRGEYRLENATQVNASAVEESDGVVAYGNLTADARRLFDAARAGNESDAYGAKAFPDQIHDHRYVKYDGEYYVLEISVGDYVVYRLSVAEVES